MFRLHGESNYTNVVSNIWNFFFNKGYALINRWYAYLWGYDKALRRPQSFERLKDLLLVKKINPNYAVLYGMNTLHFAASPEIQLCAQKDIIGLLLGHKVDVNAQPPRGGLNTPLHMLITNKRNEIALFFIDKSKK